MFKFQIDKWDEIKNIEISTVYASIKLAEEDDYVEYSHSEYGKWESVEYKFRVKKRGGYKQYVKELAEIDVEVVDLKNLIGTMAYFREIYQQAVSLYRRGVMADVALRWWDKEMLVEFSLHAAKGKEDSEILSKISVTYNDEYLVLLRTEMTENVEEDLRSHTVDAAGLYMLFKEYVLQEGEPNKT